MTTSSINSSDAAINSLEDCLISITTHCRCLIEVLKKEEKVLISGAYSDIQNLAQEKRAIMDLIYQDENKRQTVFHNILHVFNISGSNISLSSLVQQIGSPYSAKLESAHAKLLDALSDLFIINHRNSTLLRHAIYYNDCLLSMLSNFVEVTVKKDNPGTYNLSGKTESELPIVFRTAV